MAYTGHGISRACHCIGLHVSKCIPLDTLPTILEREVFIGRDSEVKELTGWIENSTIISIVGSPGFGKSTLAIHVGHVVTEKGGVAVHYMLISVRYRI